MKRYLLLLLLFCLTLTGCGGEKLVKASSFSNSEATLGKGYVMGFGPLDEKEEVQLTVENKGHEPAELELCYQDSQEGEVIYKAFRLEAKAKTMFRLKQIKDSQGLPASYSLKVVSDRASQIFVHGDSYLPEGVNYETPLDYSHETANDLKVVPIESTSSEFSLDFNLTGEISHFFIDYQGESGSVELGFYRKSDNMEMVSTLAKPNVQLNLKNDFLLDGKEESFYIRVKAVDGKPIKGVLTIGTYFI